jgi:hypothetical protein
MPGKFRLPDAVAAAAAETQPAVQEGA